jgi:soluble lytic murein transglycosylase-like protein
MISKATLTVILLVLCTAASVQARTTAAGSSSPAASGQASDGNSQPTQDANQVIQTYKTSLKNLAASYDSELKKLTERNTQLKQMAAQGYVSHLEVDQSDKAVAEAQARLDETRKQMAEADSAGTAQGELGNIIGNSQQWATGSAKIDALIRQYTALYGVDPYLVYCVMRQESGFDPTRISPKGARGLMQLMPDTAARYGVVNIADPAQNIMAGTRYLKALLQQFNGNVTLALAGYNAGEGAVVKYGNTVPPYRETIDYVRNITTRYNPKFKSVPAVKKGASGR